MDLVALGSVASVKSGFAFKSKDWTDSGIPVIKIANVKDGFLTLDGCSYVNETVAKGAAAFELKPGDILISMTGYIGEVARVRNEGRMLLNQRVGKFTVKNPSRLDNDFLFYCLRDPALKASFAAHAYGAAQPNISPSLIEQQQIPLPSIHTQRRIASILSAYDDLIENSQRRIKILESMARALYREWFVQFRFPGHEIEKFIELETGLAPARWKSGRLDSFLDVLETGNRPKGGVGDITEGVPSIGAESIVGIGQFDFSKTKYVPRDYFESMRTGIVQDRDVLVYKDGGRPGFFIPHVTLFGSGFPFEEMAINSHVYRLRAKQAVSQEYLYFYLSSEAVLHWMHMHGSGAAIPSIAREDLKQLPFVQPDEPTLVKFDTFVRPLVAQILALARQIKNLRRTRDLLLPRLLSGQINVEALA